MNKRVAWISVKHSKYRDQDGTAHKAEQSVTFLMYFHSWHERAKIDLESFDEIKESIGDRQKRTEWPTLYCQNGQEHHHDLEE